MFQGGETHSHENKVTYDRPRPVPDSPAFWLEGCTMLGLLAWYRRGLKH